MGGEGSIEKIKEQEDLDGTIGEIFDQPGFGNKPKLTIEVGESDDVDGISFEENARNPNINISLDDSFNDLLQSVQQPRNELMMSTRNATTAAAMLLVS